MSFWDWVPTIINVGSKVWGASSASKAQDTATAQQVNANNQATQTSLEAINQAKSIVQNNQNMASPGLVQLQNVIGRGDELTDVQKRSIDDARRTTLDTLQGGSLRGSARTTAAVIDDVEGRMTDRYIDTNRTKADQAASNLSGQYFNAGQNIANLDLNKGQTASQGLINAGNLNATNTVVQNSTQGRAIGDIGAVIASQVKQSQNEKKDKQYQSLSEEGFA